MAAQHLRTEDLAELRNRLLDREAELEKGAGVDEGTHGQEACADPADCSGHGLAEMLGLADELCARHELDLVRAALARMDLGSYGRCLDCGARIPLMQLRQTPQAEQCQVCEARERS